MYVTSHVPKRDVVLVRLVKITSFQLTADVHVLPSCYMSCCRLNCCSILYRMYDYFQNVEKQHLLHYSHIQASSPTAFGITVA